MSTYVTTAECAAKFDNLTKQIENLGRKTDENRGAIEKLNKTLTGNGGEGLIIEVEKMRWRNQLMDKGTSLLIGVIATLVTLWVSGQLHL